MKNLRFQIKKHLILPGFIVSLNEEEEEPPEEFFKTFKEKFKEMEAKEKDKTFWF